MKMNLFLQILTVAFYTQLTWSDDVKMNEIVSCERTPGRTICNLIDNIDDAFSWGCRGRSCDQVFQNEIHSLHNFIQTSISLDYSRVSRELAIKSRDLSYRICRHEIRADYETLVHITSLENSALRELRQIQEAFNRHSDRDIRIYSCEYPIP